jgi:hypothetical protein
MSERAIVSNLPQSPLLKVIVKSSVAGLAIGGLQGFAGYVPRLNVIFITIAAAAVGAVVAAFLGTALYLAAFRSYPVMPALRAVAVVSGTLGVLASLFLRWWTHGEGAVISMFVTPGLAIIAAGAIRAYLHFEECHPHE